MSEHRNGGIADELKELGRQLTTAVKTVATSDEVRGVGQEIRDGLKNIAREVDEAFDRVREREEVQRVKMQAGNVVESFKTGEATQEIREELSDALRALNLRLQALMERFQNRADTPVEPPTNVPIEQDDEPATGPTRRLDQ
jgi:cell division protein ZapA (FtsZ GTPase activity inhibitor)